MGAPYRRSAAALPDSFRALPVVAGRLGRRRSRVRRARRLLHKAKSDRGSIQLRLGYFHRAENLLSGLLLLPTPLRAEIIETARKPSRIQGPDRRGWDGRRRGGLAARGV